jgi:hypothetical protein
MIANPNSTSDFTISRHREQPITVRCRYLTMAQVDAVDDLFGRAIDEGLFSRAGTSLLLDAAMMIAAGWDVHGVELSRDSLRQWLTHVELIDLVRNAPGRACEDELNFLWPSRAPSGGGSSAPGADAAATA